MPLLQPPKNWTVPKRCKLGVKSMLVPFTSEKLAVRLQERAGSQEGEHTKQDMA